MNGAVASQETNTFTSVAFLAAGFAVVLLGPAAGRGQFTATRARLYGATLLLIGAASMAFHGTVTELAGWADLVAAGAIPVFAVVHRAGLRDTTTVQLYLAVICATGLFAALIGTANGRYLLAALISAAVVAELWSLTKRFRSSPPRRVHWLAAAATSLGAGTWFWYLGRDSSALCRPNSPWQWHGLWHLMAAVALFALFLHWRSEGGSVRASLGEGVGTRSERH